MKVVGAASTEALATVKATAANALLNGLIKNAPDFEGAGSYAAHSGRTIFSACSCNWPVRSGATQAHSAAGSRLSNRSLVVTPPGAEKPPLLPPAPSTRWQGTMIRSEEHTSELQS